MCYVTFLSTTSPADLQGLGDGHFQLRRVEADEQEPATSRLSYPNRWFLGGRNGGCSCHFRNWHRQNPPEFWEPQDWYEEDPEDVEATRQFYDLLASLICDGERVDLVTAWSLEDAERDQEPSLSTVGREAFRFMEAFHFEVGP